LAFYIRQLGADVLGGPRSHSNVWFRYVTIAGRRITGAAASTPRQRFTPPNNRGSGLQAAPTVHAAQQPGQRPPGRANEYPITISSRDEIYAADISRNVKYLKTAQNEKL